MLIIKIHSINMLHLRMRYILRFRSQYAPQAAHADHQKYICKSTTFPDFIYPRLLSVQFALEDKKS